MLKQACIAISLILSLSACYSNGQQSCPENNNNGGALVGFTALTPEQLQTTIRSSIQASISEASESLNNILSEETSSSLNELNQTLQDGLTSVRELNEQLEASILGNIESTVEKQVKLALADAIRDIIANISVQPLSTQPPPPTTKPTAPEPTTKPTTTEPTTEPTTTEPTTEPTTETPALPPVGLTPLNPATSCQQILVSIPGAISGIYWVWSISNNGQRTPTRVYCDMERSCGGLTGGWMRVANLNMKDITQTCPNNFRVVTQTQTSLRLCATENTGIGCYGTFFSVTGVSYSHVCGRVTGYQDSTPNAFYSYHIDTTLTINEPYVDGISLTHGTGREHIWTFVAAKDEILGHLSACGCSNRNAEQQARIPNFVGNDYFCDTGSRDEAEYKLYSEDPLWDGQGCGSTSSCCTFNNPPWFYKNLSRSSSNDIEMRVCRDSGFLNEDILFEIVELYIR